jgi:hypothetical protein
MWALRMVNPAGRNVWGRINTELEDLHIRNNGVLYGAFTQVSTCGYIF